jgi:maltokinase
MGRHAGPGAVARQVPDDDVLSLVQAWLPSRRWYPAKGTDHVLARVGVLELEDPAGEARVGVHLLGLPWGGVLQVPVVAGTALPDDDPAVLGWTGDGRQLADGCAHPAFWRAWLAAAEHDAPVEPGDLASARPLTGEQSNTSVLLPGAVPAAILKVFRAVTPGPNPDVVVPRALHDVGWRGVPAPLAWLTATWPGPDGPATGHLGVLSELVVGARDGFELACAMAGRGESFADLAEDLGATTAGMHAALRRALPTASPDKPANAAAVLATLRSRADAACDAAPELAARREAVHAVLGRVLHVGPLPALQRVHGDYHLGQVLHWDQGWSVLDFEGEPSASATERERPDVAVRDLAGMLRSIDYAAAVGGAAGPDWAEEARAALTAGYVAQAGRDPATAALAHLLELDKALYEVVYEVRNRPAWVPIPLAGVDRLLSR